MDEEELLMKVMSRQKMIDFIEGRVGIWEAVWNEWPTKQIEILYYNLLNRG